MIQTPSTQGSVGWLDTTEILREETAELWGAQEAEDIWKHPDPAREYGRRMLARGQAALCLSGGGIRSAAFALGIVQALAQKGLLREFQYLSTVSGGGYLGGFLLRWIAERNHDVDAVQAELAGGATVCASEPAPIRWLRENSNFVTPRVGIASADTWTTIATSVRNILINWLVFAPALLIAVAVPHLGAALLVVSDGLFADLCLLLGTVLVGYAAWQGAHNLPSHLEQGRKDGGYVFRRIVLPATLGAAALTGGVAPDLLAPGDQAIHRPLIGFLRLGWLTFLSDSAVVAQTLEIAFLCAVAGLLGGYFAAWLTASRISGRGVSNRKVFLSNLHVWAIGSAGAAFVYVAGLAQIPNVPCPDARGCGLRTDVLAALGVFWSILAQLVVVILFVAFRRVHSSHELSPDLDREWLARLSAQKIRLALAWALFASATLLFWHVVVWLSVEFQNGSLSYEDKGRIGTIVQWVTAAVGALAGITAAFGGKASVEGDQGWVKRLLASRAFVAAATFVALVLLLSALGRIEFSIADWLARGLTFAGSWALVISHLVVLAVVGALLWFTSSSVNVNRFSLNGMYRNRLARAFLGAARQARKDADPFTGFAPSDNIRLHALKAADGASGRRVLMPVVNVALNLVGGARLAWQERKAQSFIFTPIACGSAALAENPATGECAGRYIRTDIYAGNEPDLGLPGKGVSLATAVAISGAAASPSMGYHSSPATAFLMTLCNVRLGAWLPNPGRTDLPAEVMKSSGPPNALLPLIRELLGLTDATGRAVYLSDGGHFENLGLYEMVRRRCRYIVVSDAGCDPGATFEDLGNAVRKIRIDLGVDIDIKTVRIASRDKWQKDISTFFALGTIRYPEGEGELLYIKPACAEDIPSDVRAYALARKDFPHETTADQWFSESQFESYRSLGASLAGRLGNANYAAGGLAGFFADVKSRLTATSQAPQPPSAPAPAGLTLVEPPKPAALGGAA